MNQQDYIPEEWRGQKSPRDQQKRVSVGTLIAIVCVAVVFSILLTYTLTSAAKRSYYSEKLEAQQQVIEQLQQYGSSSSDIDYEKLQILASIFNAYGYYAGEKSEEELLDAVLKAYAEATGDPYAEYYSDEEFEALMSDNAGSQEGIGVSVIQTDLTVGGYSYSVFQIIAVFENSPAEKVGVRVGDYLYCIKVDGAYRTVTELGGFTPAINHIRGEKGTQVEFAVFRPTANDFEVKEFTAIRDAYESVSVTGFFSEQDPTVGIVRISNFDLTTPTQLKAAVNRLLSGGAQHFVFDVRNNPGGDLQSIKAVMTYFLQKGDVILSSVDRDGNKVQSYYAEAMKLKDEYAACNVSEQEIGMYADLDMVVLCNGNTASAAEVFTATMRDYGLAKIVGETTFGKGIMQSYLPLSVFSANLTGYLKLTTYAYVTKCDVTYHEIGISPTDGCEIALSDEAQQYNFYVLPQSLDDQLKLALTQFQ